MSCAESNCYIVQGGDTPYTISKLYNISLDDLIESNPDLDPDHLLPGQILTIPLATQSEDCPWGAAAYIVEKNETFYSIAKRHKMRLSELLKANPNINPDALLVGQSICIPMISASFTNETYRVKFIYPYLWSRFNNERYEGIDGFVQVSAIANDASLEEICKKEAYHKLKPYGTQPIIIMSELNGREACYIIPSADQPMEMRSQSAFIAAYEKPVEIKGISYKYFVLWADKEHLQDIINTLEIY